MRRVLLRTTSHTRQLTPSTSVSPIHHGDDALESSPCNQITPPGTYRPQTNLRRAIGSTTGRTPLPTRVRKPRGGMYSDRRPMGTINVINVLTPKQHTKRSKLSFASKTALGTGAGTGPLAMTSPLPPRRSRCQSSGARLASGSSGLHRSSHCFALNTPPTTFYNGDEGTSDTNHYSTSTQRSRR